MHSAGGRQLVCSRGWGLWAVWPGGGCCGGSTTYSHKSCWPAGKTICSFLTISILALRLLKAQAHFSRQECSRKWLITRNSFHSLRCRVFKLLLEACTVLHLLPTMRFGQLVSMMRVHWVALQVMNHKSHWRLAWKLCSHHCFEFCVLLS